jgi:hypothetical protein
MDSPRSIHGMDEALFSKLPLGNDWWKISYPHTEAWWQAPYEPLPVRAKPTHNVHVTPSAPQIKHRAHVSVPSNAKGTPIWLDILRRLDPCCDLYHRTQQQDAMACIRKRLLEFVLGPAQHHFGPKKSRYLASWLSGNRVDATEATPIIKDFLRFMFDSAMDVSQDAHGKWFVKI